ncbi:MAG: hypothetical protein KDA41_21310 [Planctomycetales bacterium]|nr:hypothetical protein [Planctomycetales bacterium]
MRQTDSPSGDASAAAMAEPDPPFGSNTLRLDARGWIAVTLLTLATLAALPRMWKRFEPLDDSPDYRIPYAHSNDYWHYQRIAVRAESRQQVALLGDSVVWGEYVPPQQTLSHYLNEQAGADRFVNLGLNGAHPLALEGLTSCYATALRDRPVVVHCNLLWMSSPERDLQVDKETTFNHPHLAPQLLPSIPCYKASLADRMGIVVDRNLEIRGWAQHLRIAYFESQDVPSWTLEHPYDNPLSQFKLTAATSQEEARHAAVPWHEQGLEQQDLPWIELETSLQWQAFRRTIDMLESRGDRVFVVIGPLNEHMLTPLSRARFQQLRVGVETWLRERKTPYMSPAPLPSDEYGDASHPLAAGYERLAHELYGSPEFQDWIKQPETSRQ